MRPLLVSSGEPAGIGPDLCLELARCELPLVVLGDRKVLEARARLLNKPVRFLTYSLGEPVQPQLGCLYVLSLPCPNPVVCGQLDPANASYVLELLTLGAGLCKSGDFSALVTAPVHKANINTAGFSFTGHTEFFAHYFGVDTVVMLLACEAMKVALVTTHMPLRQVSDAITPGLLNTVIKQLYHSLQVDFNIANPHIKVAGLNPHAGESGYLGQEEIETISPAVKILQAQGMAVTGPYPADTLFLGEKPGGCDAYVTMYHDQGLSVLKYASFNQAVNITLGLPIVRTSVDHGTALELAGTGKSDAGSLLAAVHMGCLIAKNRMQA